MLKQLLILLICLQWSAITALSQRNPLKTYGTVAGSQTVYMKTTEVSVLDWVEFIANNNFDTTLFPQSNAVPAIIAELFANLANNPERPYLLFERRKLPAYDNARLLTAKPGPVLKNLFKNDTNGITLNIPITGITYEQAIQFCRWKERILNDGKTVKLKLALPTVEMYKRVIPNKDSLNQKKCALFNWAFCNCIGFSKKKYNRAQGKSLLRVDSYWPSDLGLYNVQGNAAEMTATKGIAMGGSFRHVARESFNDRVQEYHQPEDWLGFRYVVTFQ